MVGWVTYLVACSFIEHDDLLDGAVEGEKGVQGVNGDREQALSDAGDEDIGGFGGAPRPQVLGVGDVTHCLERWVGGWVGWVEEKKAVRMRCCGSFVWVGG